MEKNGGMRGSPDRQLAMLTTLSTEDLIPADHPIRRIRRVVDAVLAELDGVFDAMYATGGRPSVPPEQLLKATVLMALYSIRSERAFCERLNYDLLFKWFLDLRIDEPAFDATTFSKNRRRLLDHEVADRFFAPSSARPSCAATCPATTSPSTGRCWRRGRRTRASNPKTARRPVRRPGRNAEANFHGEKRSNTTHASTTDPESRLYRKSAAAPAKLCFMGHLLMEHRNALIVDMELTEADGYAERDAAVEMLDRLPASETAPHRRRRQGLRHQRLRRPRPPAGLHPPRRPEHHQPAPAPSTGAPPATPATTVSQRIRKRIEEPFGWIKTIAGGRKLRYIGRQRNRAWFLLTGAVYNILRITELDLQH